MQSIAWFLISVIAIFILGVVSNASVPSLVRIQYQFDRLSCPLPIAHGQDQLILDGDLAFGVNITHTASPDNGTKYTCEFDPLSGPSGATTFYADYKNYEQTCFSVIPCGWFTYLLDTLTMIADKFGAFFALLVYFLTPINFNIMGYDINDVGGLGLAFLIGTYIFFYIGIGQYFAVYIAGLIGRFL